MDWADSSFGRLGLNPGNDQEEDLSAEMGSHVLAQLAHCLRKDHVQSYCLSCRLGIRLPIVQAPMAGVAARTGRRGINAGAGLAGYRTNGLEQAVGMIEQTRA